jgi:hypothetical protein
VDIQPAHDAMAVGPVGAERQLAHRRRIDDDAGDDRHTKQDAHQTQEQLSREACKHVGVQLQHDVGEAPGHVGRVQIRRSVGIDADEAVGGGIDIQRLADRQQQRALLVRIPHQEVHDVACLTREAAGDDAVEVGFRRAFRHLRRLHLLVQQLVDLFVKDQRQPGHAQQQHEQRANEAGPLVNPAPFAECCV